VGGGIERAQDPAAQPGLEVAARIAADGQIQVALVIDGVGPHALADLDEVAARERDVGEGGEPAVGGLEEVGGAAVPAGVAGLLLEDAAGLGLELLVGVRLQARRARDRAVAELRLGQRGSFPRRALWAWGVWALVVLWPVATDQHSLTPGRVNIVGR
jgi:hypothetical protein